MGISTGSDCIISGDWNICPADAMLEFQGEKNQLYATLSCPFDAVRESGFIATSQEGLCQCEAKLAEVGVSEEEAEDIACNCFACSPGVPFAFAYECERRLVGPCAIFNCDGVCNGELDFGTFPPTAAPTAVPTDVQVPTSVPTSPTTEPTTAPTAVPTSEPTSSGATYRTHVNNYDANMSSMTLLALGLVVFRMMMIYE